MGMGEGVMYIALLLCCLKGCGRWMLQRERCGGNVHSFYSKEIDLGDEWIGALCT